MRLLPLMMIAALPATAQQLDLPRPSLGAKVAQTVGITEISLEYSSPAARGRAIFGNVVPFGQVWRTGANSATKITFSKDVQVGGKTVAAGTYALFTLPGKEAWTLIVNRDQNQFGAFSYKESEDVVRVEARPEAVAPRERMTFLFADTTDDGTRLDLEWDRTRVSLPIRVATGQQVLASIAALEKTGWRPWNQAAAFMLQKKDYGAGLRLVDQSLKLGEQWGNLWTKAQLLAGKGEYREARALAERAQQLGAKDEQGFFAADDVKKALAEWKR